MNCLGFKLLAHVDKNGPKESLPRKYALFFLLDLELYFPMLEDTQGI